MSKYTAPHRATNKRSLSRRARIVLLASMLVPASLLAIANLPASAAAKYATIQDVHDAINAALAPINSAIASLQQTQTNQAAQLSSQQTAITNLQSTQTTHTSQISDLQSQQTNQAQAIANLQDSTAKSLKAYDANGHELGLVVGAGNNSVTIYSPLLNKFMYIATNSYAEDPNNHQGFTASGLGYSPLSRIYYQSSDCTGTPYGDYNQDGFVTNTVMPFSSTEYYIYHAFDTAVTFGSFSYRSSNSPNTCQYGITALTGSPLYPLTLPFPTPIAEPVQFKYQ